MPSNDRAAPGRRNGTSTIEKLIGMFSPFAAMSRELQLQFALERPPACSVQHGRLEILLRGGGMTTAPIETRIALARRLTDAARPLVREQRKYRRRRLAERAVSVVFEDEQIVDGGIATSRFTYVASHDHDMQQ